MTAFGVLETDAEHDGMNVIGQQSLDVAPHVVGVRHIRRRAYIKWGDALVAVMLQLCLDDLSLIFGLVERSAADRD